jgi:hypothetical protein
MEHALTHISSRKKTPNHSNDQTKQSYAHTHAPGCHTAHEFFSILLMLLCDIVLMRGRIGGHQWQGITPSSYLCQNRRHVSSVQCSAMQ